MTTLYLHTIEFRYLHWYTIQYICFQEFQIWPDSLQTHSERETTRRRRSKDVFFFVVWKQVEGMVCSPMLTNASITKPPVCCFCPLCLSAVPTTNSWQQTNVQICNSTLHNEPRLHHTGKCICTYTDIAIQAFKHNLSNACIILASVFAPTLGSPYKHSNTTFPMQLLTCKVPTSKVVTKVQLKLWGHKSYWRLTALEGLLDKRKIMLRMLKMSDIAIFCSNPLLGFPSPFLSPLRLKLASESLVWHHLTMSASQYIVCI